MQPASTSPHAAARIVTWALAIAACNQPAPAVTDVSDAASAEDAVADTHLSSDAASRDVATNAGASDAGPDIGLDRQERIASACASACVARKPSEVMGFCPLSAEAGCSDWCEDVSAATDDALVEALWTCVATDPLCFQSPLQCVLAALYPDPQPLTVTVAGTGFGVPDGTRVVVAVSDDRGGYVRGAGAVGSDGFAVAVDVVGSMNGTRFTYFAVDADGDGRCSDGDVRGVGNFAVWEWPRERIELPVWTINVGPDNVSDRVDCSELGDD